MHSNHGSHLENPRFPFQPLSLQFDSPGEHLCDMAGDDSTRFRRDSINSLSPASEHKFAFTSINPSGAFHSNDSVMPHSAHTWSFQHNSDNASPINMGHYQHSEDFVLQQVPQDMQIARRVSAPTHFGDVHSDLSADSSTIRSPQSTTSTPEHMELVSSLQQAIGMPRHMRHSHRSQRPHPSRSASDGIRKKNTRIDIPAERNLHNIDELIEKAGDEEQLKELKAQRRLLRNREAALASRQRKKQHTEDLEHKEQRYVKEINMLRADLNEQTCINQRLGASYQAMHERYTNACHSINAAALQHEELVMTHTQETGRLRQQIQYLKAQLANIESRGEALDSDTQDGLGSFTSNMGALSVDPQSLGIHVNHSNTNSETSPLYGHFQHAQTTPADNVRQAIEQPIASGVLFMLLLCGAFVASKSSGNPVIPRLPDEVRAASTTVLDNLLQDPAADALASGTGMQSIMSQALAGAQPTHQPIPWDRAMQSDGRPNMHRSLTMPTSQQAADQLFSMTPAEYASLTSPEGYVTHTAQPVAPQKRNLAETLAGLRQESFAKGNAAEVYTRSLLWDQIPMDVVRQFKDLIKANKNNDESAGSTNGQQTKSELSDNTMWAYHNMDTSGYHD